MVFVLVQQVAFHSIELTNGLEIDEWQFERWTNFLELISLCDQQLIV